MGFETRCTLSVRGSGNYTVYLFLIIINELGIASRLIASHTVLPDGGYLAHPHSHWSYYFGPVTQTAHSSIYLAAPEISALSCRLCISQTHSRSSTERPRKLTCRHFRSVGITGNARQSLLHCNNAD